MQGQGGRQDQPSIVHPRRRSSKAIWMRSGWLSDSIFWVLLAWGRFGVTKAIIPDGPEHFLTPSARRDTHLFGGLGLNIPENGRGLIISAKPPQQTQPPALAGLVQSILRTCPDHYDYGRELAGRTGRTVRRLIATSRYRWLHRPPVRQIAPACSPIFGQFAPLSCRCRNT